MKAYVRETNSQDALVIIRDAGVPVIFSHFHAVEIPNAIHLKRFRGAITHTEEATAMQDLRADIASGILDRPVYDLGSVYMRAERLSDRYSAIAGTRSLDVLHVAAALECGCTTLASFDDRQRKMARLAGLKLLPAK